MKCKYNDGVHVCKTIDGEHFILYYCENYSMNVKWFDKKFPLLN